MSNPLVKAVVMSLIRRFLGYAGVAAAVSPALTDTVMQSGGVVVAALTVLWSLYGKIQAARD